MSLFDNLISCKGSISMNSGLGLDDEYYITDNVSCSYNLHAS